MGRCWQLDQSKKMEQRRSSCCRKVTFCWDVQICIFKDSVRISFVPSWLSDVSFLYPMMTSLWGIPQPPHKPAQEFEHKVVDQWFSAFWILNSTNHWLHRAKHNEITFFLFVVLNVIWWKTCCFCPNATENYCCYFIPCILITCKIR